MRTMLEKKPILHALIWIVAYIVVVNIGDNLGVGLGLERPWLTGALLVCLAAVLGGYVIRNGWAGRFGLAAPRARAWRTAWAWLPLVVLAVGQLDGGVHATAGLFWSALLEMAGVGVVEEVLFRGFLFRAIEDDLGLWWAVLISGVTFGLGHLVNLARGYSIGQEIGQIVAAVIIGLVLTLLVAVTGSLLPGIVFHIAFNVVGTISPGAGPGWYTGVMAVVAVAYGSWLVGVLMRRRRSGAGPAARTSPGPSLPPGPADDRGGSRPARYS